MKSRLLIYLLPIIIFCSCEETATLFLPNSITYDLLTEKGANRVGASVKFSDTDITAGELQAAYVPIEKLSVSTNWSYYHKSIDDFEKREQLFGELAVGTYFKKDFSETSSSIFELSAGYGLSDATDFRSNNVSEGGITFRVQDRFYAKSRRLFTQVNWGFRYISPENLHLKTGPALRFSNVNIYEISHISSQRTLNLDTPKMNILDIGHNFGIGVNNFYFMGQIMLTVPIGNESEDFFNEYVESNGGNFSLILGAKVEF